MDLCINTTLTTPTQAPPTTNPTLPESRCLCCSLDVATAIVGGRLGDDGEVRHIGASGAAAVSIITPRYHLLLIIIIIIINNNNNKK